MPPGGHYEVVQSDEYRFRYDELADGNARLVSAHEGLVQWLERSPTTFPVSVQIHADYWLARIYGPPWVSVFYTIDDERRRVTLNGMTPWPQLNC